MEFNSSKLLGVEIDSMLNFKVQIRSMCKKSILNALTTVFGYMNSDKGGLIMNAFFFSQFTYFPLT